MQGAPVPSEVRPRRVRVERPRPRVLRARATRRHVADGSRAKGVPARPAVGMRPEGGSPPGSASIPGLVPSGRTLRARGSVPREAGALVLGVRALNEGQVPRKAASSTDQGVIFPAAADLTYPANALPVGVARRAPSATGPSYVPEAQAVPGTRVRR